VASEEFFVVGREKFRKLIAPLYSRSVGEERQATQLRPVGKLLWTVVALVVVLCLGVLIYTQFRDLHISKVARAVFSGRRAHLGTTADKRRKVYPFSVVPGGVYSAEELARSRRIDPVVARHYAGLGTNVTVQKTVRDTYMYVSYRKEDKVYWTKGKHRIKQGEYVVSDGQNFVRARCGNRLSAVPQEPVMNADEPADDRLDKPGAPGDTYLASVEPSPGEPLFSVPSTEPVLDGLTDNAPKTATEKPVAQAANQFSSVPTPGAWSPFVGQGSPTATTTPSVPLTNLPETSNLPSDTSTTPVIVPVIPVVETPEPAALAFVLSGAVGLLIYRGTRKRRTA
jgi:hypothetical protein